MISGNLISALPGYHGKTSLVTKKQSVSDIMREIIKAHKEYTGDYNKICASFDAPTIGEICAKISAYLKKNIAYRMEPEERQTIKSPTAILYEGYGDCKHYASFAGGILDALKRKGKKIDWAYRFASYSVFSPEPEHIFTIVKVNGREIWIDPTPGAAQNSPVWINDKKVNTKNMALYRINGVNDPVNFLIEDLSDHELNRRNPVLVNAISLLLQYGVLNDKSEVNDNRLTQLQYLVSPEIYNNLKAARNTIQNAAVGSFFKKIFGGVKTVSLAAPRAAYMSLVALNVFGLARKLYAATHNEDGSLSDGSLKVRKKWESLGGAYTKLLKAIESGHKKKAILGAARINGPEIPAWVAIASAIMAAMTPLLKEILDSKKQATGVNYDLDPQTGENLPDPPGSGGSMFSNPLLIGGVVLAAVLLLKKKS